MTQKYRLVFLTLSFVVLLGVSYAVTGSFQFLFADFWFTAGILLLILLSIVDQPHFSKDANVFVNGVAGLISLLAVTRADRDSIWSLFFVWCVYLILTSYLLMLSRSRELPREGSLIQLLSRLNREVGRPEALFSAFFLWGVISQFGYRARPFRVLLFYWAVFIILNLPSVSRALAKALETKGSSSGDAVGVIASFLSPSVFDCTLDAAQPALDPGTSLSVHCKDDQIAGTVIVVEDRVLLGRRHARLAVTATTEHWAGLADEGMASKAVIRLTTEETARPVSAPVGIVGQGTQIGDLRLLVNPAADLEEGEVLRVDIPRSGQAFYQIVTARITDSSLESTLGLQHIEVTASQLGVWHQKRSRFEPVSWVPPAGGLVFKVRSEKEIEYPIPDRSVRLGTVPNSSFPVHFDLSDGVTHNTAIIGVTGSGKSFLTFHVIEAFVQLGIKVLILDLSRQHWLFLQALSPYPIKTVEDVGDWFRGDTPIGIHQFADAKSHPQRTAALVMKIFEELAGKVKLRAGENEPARVCVVFEEAHSLIPEWNQVASRSDSDHVNKTARTILQGRKYGMGCLVVTQRTANVTKTILNQCNTIFALRSFDQTGLDFLKNYMGESYAHAISTLPVRHSILVGKASSSTRPIMFEIEDFSRRWGDEAPLQGSNQE